MRIILSCFCFMLILLVLATAYTSQNGTYRIEVKENSKIIIHSKDRQRHEFFVQQPTSVLVQSLQIYDGYYDPRPKVVEDHFWESKHDEGYEETSNCNNIKDDIGELVETMKASSFFKMNRSLDLSALSLINDLILKKKCGSFEMYQALRTINKNMQEKINLALRAGLLIEVKKILGLIV